MIMADDYTPHSDQIREAWAIMARGVRTSTRSTLADGRAEFDRWLAATIWLAEINAVREYADQLGVYVGDEDSEYWTGYRQAQREAMLRAQRYVDQMAAGGDHA